LQKYSDSSPRQHVIFPWNPHGVPSFRNHEHVDAGSSSTRLMIAQSRMRMVAAAPVAAVLSKMQ
jgi:hypothetical protein